MTTTPPKISPKPLICVPGEERPAGVPYVEGEECSTWNAFVHYGAEAHRRMEFCRTIPYECLEHGSDRCAPWDVCSKAHLPSLLVDLGSWRVSMHPFMQIVYHLDRWGTDDFRSGEAFDKMADDVLIESLVRDRELTMLYPAAGSHMTPILLPLKLIDSGKIDSAKITYTEVDTDALSRVRTYLEFLASPEQGVFKNLTETRIDKDEGYEVVFTFEYKGKKITLTYGMNRGGEVYSPDEYIQESELIIFHDTFTPGQDGMADQFMQKIDEYSTGEHARPRIVISENRWECDGYSTTCTIAGKERGVKHVKGYYYGCGKDWVTGKPPRYLVEKQPDGSHRMVANREKDEFAPDRPLHNASGADYTARMDPIMIYIPVSR